MPFKETCPVEERISMLREYDTGLLTASEVAVRYGVSRSTFYFWQQRRAGGGPEWYMARSHAAKNCPHRTDDATIASVLALRDRFPRFGPKKLKARLELDHPGQSWPAASTIGDILKRHGRIQDKPARRRPLAQGDIVAGADQPNGEWSIDFKGWFRTKNGTRCDPLTIVDTASRYLIEVRITEPTWAGVRGALERTFEVNGLPDAIRSDNGAPFGSRGGGGLSSLAVWWLKLGIEPRYIPPGSPQHNGRHERLHRTLKDETTRPPAETACEQQRRFDAFRHYYNEDRPHEALDQTTPARHWQPSLRRLPDCPDTPWYDADHEVRRVRQNGSIKWRGKFVFVSEALSGETVGLLEQDNATHLVRFYNRDLGVITTNQRFHCFAPPRARLRYAKEARK